MARRSARGSRPAPSASRAATASAIWALLAAAAAPAQVHELGDLPWQSLTPDGARRGVAMSWQHLRDGDTGWQADRLGLTILVPLGQRALFFLREDHVRFDSGGLRAFERWPRARFDDAEAGTSADPEWPFETVVNGFGRPDLGLILPLRLPLAGGGALGLLAGLPVGTDRLYPLSSACLPLVVDWRLARRLGGAGHLAARIGREHTFAPSGDDLAGDAFPGGWRYGFELGLGAGDRGAALAWSARELDGGRRVRRLVLEGWVPLGEGHRLGLHVARDLSGRDDRLAAWLAGLTWHLAGLPRDAAQNETR